VLHAIFQTVVEHTTTARRASWAPAISRMVF